MVAYSSIAVLEKGKAIITTHERWLEKEKRGKEWFTPGFYSEGKAVIKRKVDHHNFIFLETLS